ncbi:hypothetical protein [Dysgonomonas reticulitermitis]
MKHIYLVIVMFLMSGVFIGANAQSISASKILSYLNGQKQTVISADLSKLGFVQTEKKETTTFVGYAYTKKGRAGVENINIAINDELFSIIYKPSTTAIYSALKEKMLTKDFEYSYSHQSTKYYESTNMRIGINDTGKIISFFVKKK